MNAIYLQSRFTGCFLSARMKWVIPVLMVFEYFWITVSVSDDGLFFCLFVFSSSEPIVVLTMSEAFLDWWGCFCVFQEQITSRPTTDWPMMRTSRCVWPLVSANTMRIKTRPSSVRPRPSGYQRTRCSTSWLSSPHLNLHVTVRTVGDNWWHNLQENGSVQ